MVGISNDDERGGGRSSGGCGVSAAACKQAGCRASVAPRVVASATDARAGPFGHRGFAGDEPVRRSGSAPVEEEARGSVRVREAGEKMAELTGSRMGGSFGLGKRRSKRAAKGISGGPRLKKRSGEPLQGIFCRIFFNLKFE